MMADLIDREAAVMDVLGLTIVDPMVAQYADAVLFSIQQEPAVDAVEVIRCKDCKNYGDEYFCPLRSLADYTDPNDYCSMGERRGHDG